MYHCCHLQSTLSHTFGIWFIIMISNMFAKQSFSITYYSIFWSLSAYSPHPASNGSEWHLYLIAYSNWSAVKPFKPVQFLLMIFVCYMSAGIISETSPHHCVSNGATLRKEYALHVLSHQICKYSLAAKNTYTYLGCLANLYTFFNLKNYQKPGILLYLTILFIVILFLKNRLRNTKKV